MTIADADHFIDEPFVGELCAERGSIVHRTIDDDQTIDQLARSGERWTGRIRSQMLSPLTDQQIRKSACKRTFAEDARKEAVGVLQRHERLCGSKDGSVVAIAIDLFPRRIVFETDEVVVERYEFETKVEQRDVREHGFLIEELQTRLGPVRNERDGICVLQRRCWAYASISPKMFWCSVMRSMAKAEKQASQLQLIDSSRGTRIGWNVASRHNPASVEAKAELGCIRKGLRWEHPCQEDLLVIWTLTDRMPIVEEI
ncbi:hypothetical protein PHSY_001720 [Pseudozyma hubeiensis SY62]|uniref:Uncharacterized protein n=1 Tax=Pseudozyma hubeiensis (strain SY62) TaxID=1305764 RepID=R9NZF5_PSEHS|nr:hypothetical protein PHSY_001720 [Pseudozyma hubeiensis SY62]GAC94151.1 hypothetical protein PHSY_001720 [Pseudozyma hubeiensis SY62]